MKDIVQIYDPSTAAMIPNTNHELKQLVKLGIGSNTIQKRTVDWIKQNSQCTDHIQVKQNTLKQADRRARAFAKHFISKNDIIATLPLIHILDKIYFE